MAEDVHRDIVKRGLLPRRPPARGKGLCRPRKCAMLFP